MLEKLQQKLRYLDVLMHTSVTCLLARPTLVCEHMVFQPCIYCKVQFLCMQESHAANVAALHTDLADSKQETVAAKAAAEISVKEAVLSAEKKVHRLTERTAKVTLHCLSDRFS